MRRRTTVRKRWLGRACRSVEADAACSTGCRRGRGGAQAPAETARSFRARPLSARAPQRNSSTWSATQVRNPLEGYPGLGAVALGTIPVLPGELRLAEHELALMEAGGIPADRAALAVDLIAQFAASTAVERTVRHGRGGTGDERGRVRVAYEHADPESFPRVARSAALLTGPDETARRDFSIEVLLSGIERPG